MGVKMLKKMGWREGQGIGMKMTRKALEKQKLNEDRARSRKGNYDEEAVKEAEEMAPNFQFAPTDFDPDLLKSHEGLHGLGYQAIQSTSVLSEKYGTIEASLKTRAFGVGAFEDDDESIYTNYDFSQYDFSIGPGGKAAYASCSASDTSFVMAERRQPARQFFEPPRLPTNFRPIHTPIHPDISQMPANIKQFGEKMNHLQRAKLLGEVDPKAVLELIHDKDRKRLTASASRTSMNSEDLLKNAFEEEPMKQARFKQYVHYLKRVVQREKFA
ncbi:unnamed protein product [Gongylonema pulchrum]|uniref:G-patch domain-containing protein n=1 Tax=Gongylonema pulchrum TaxID=637853 RepID=A0A183E2D3_9BILA|nr:unnamed protein product [Gongylonema pulchrum]